MLPPKRQKCSFSQCWVCISIRSYDWSTNTNFMPCLIPKEKFYIGYVRVTMICCRTVHFSLFFLPCSHHTSCSSLHTLLLPVPVGLNIHARMGEVKWGQIPWEKQEEREFIVAAIAIYRVHQPQSDMSSMSHSEAWKHFGYWQAAGISEQCERPWRGQRDREGWQWSKVSGTDVAGQGEEEMGEGSGKNHGAESGQTSWI